MYFTGGIHFMRSYDKWYGNENMIRITIETHQNLEFQMY